MIQRDLTGWGFFQQGSDQTQEVQELGVVLSLRLDCAVHYPAFGKHLFECKCGVLFPIFLIKGGNWEAILRHHAEGFRPPEEGSL